MHQLLLLAPDHGVIVEEGSPTKLFTNPAHTRTRDFLRQVVER